MLRRVVATAIKSILAIAGLVLVVMWMSGMFRDKITPDVATATAEPRWSGATTTVAEVTVPIVERAAGTVQATRRTRVAAKILAQILELPVHAGDQVAAGDLIARLDARDLTARLQQAHDRQQTAKATLDQADLDHSRAQKLVADGTISQSEYDRMKSALDVARSQWEAARRAHEEADVDLSFAEILAPAAGIVVERLAEPGDLASPGRALVEIYDPEALRLEVPLRESLAVGLELGREVEVGIDALGESLAGRIDEIVPQAEVGARTLLVKVVLPRRPGLYAGMFGRLLLPIGERRACVVADRAIERIGQLEFVRILSAADGVARRRLITTGRDLADGQREVLSGLAAGDVVALR